MPPTDPSAYGRYESGSGSSTGGFDRAALLRQKLFDLESELEHLRMQRDAALARENDEMPEDGDEILLTQLKGRIVELRIDIAGYRDELQDAGASLAPARSSRYTPTGYGSAAYPARSGAGSYRGDRPLADVTGGFPAVVATRTGAMISPGAVTGGWPVSVVPGRPRPRRRRKRLWAILVLILVVGGYTVRAVQVHSAPATPLAVLQSDVKAACRNPAVAAQPTGTNFACGPNQSLLWVYAIVLNREQLKTNEAGGTLIPLPTGYAAGIAEQDLKGYLSTTPAIANLEEAAWLLNDIVGGSIVTNKAPKKSVRQEGLELTHCDVYTGSLAQSSVKTSIGNLPVCKGGVSPGGVSPGGAPEGALALAKDLLTYYYQKLPWKPGTTPSDTVLTNTLNTVQALLQSPSGTQAQAALASWGLT